MHLSQGIILLMENRKCLMHNYVFAPAGPGVFHNNMLKTAVEFIGSQQEGCGSSWAKGKRYLKRKLFCSGTAIKRTCVIKNKYMKHDYEKYGSEVYYYHKDDCACIVGTILNYIVDHKNDNTLPEELSNKSFQELLTKTYHHRISQIEWVRDMDYKKQGNEAKIVCEKLNALR